MSTGPAGIPGDVQMHLVECWDDAAEFRRWLGERRPVLAVDTETSGLEWWDGELRLVQFGDAMSGWAVPFEPWKGLVRESLVEYEDPLVFHNAKFDLHWLETNGAFPRRPMVNDTAVMAHLVSPDQRVGLKECSARWLDSRAATGQSELKKAMSKAQWTWGNIPIDFEGYWVYAALDVVLTARLYEHLVPQVRADFGRVYDLEMAASHILMDMETRGVRVDLDYCQREYDRLHAYSTEAREWCRQEYGFEIGSNRNIAARLMADGIVLTARTDKGQWKMSEDILSTIDHPLAQTVLSVRKAEKVANSYFKNFTEMADGDILHPSVRPLGARTGRMSVTNPALQTLPRGRMVRDAFIAREGHTMLGADYEQVEMRLAAHFSEDRGLIDAFMSGEDFFSVMGRSIFDDPDFQKGDPRRSLVKNGMYAKVYGSGTSRFAETVGISEGDAKLFMAKLDQSFPGLRAFADTVQRTASARGMREGTEYVRTPTGRRLVAPDGRAYALVNAAIQGTAADIFKQAIVEMDAAGIADYLVMPVHDELILSVPTEDVAEVEQTLVKVMERDDFRVPLRVDSHTGERWGELK